MSALTFGGSGIEVGTASLTVCADGIGVKGRVRCGAFHVVCFLGGRVEVGMMFAERTEFVTKVAQFVLEILVIVQSKAHSILQLAFDAIKLSLSFSALSCSEFAKAGRRPQRG